MFDFHQGRECFACAPTGSGKTFAFVFPVLMKLKVHIYWHCYVAHHHFYYKLEDIWQPSFFDQHTSKDGVRAVILSPTKELAAQTTRECKKLARKKFYIRLMTKQLAKSGDFSKLRCDVLISTPLRLKFAIQKRKLDLSRYVPHFLGFKLLCASVGISAFNLIDIKSVW